MGGPDVSPLLDTHEGLRRVPVGPPPLPGRGPPVFASRLRERVWGVACVHCVVPYVLSVFVPALRPVTSRPVRLPRRDPPTLRSPDPTADTDTTPCSERTPYVQLSHSPSQDYRRGMKFTEPFFWISRTHTHKYLSLVLYVSTNFTHLDPRPVCRQVT